MTANRIEELARNLQVAFGNELWWSGRPISECENDLQRLGWLDEENAFRAAAAAADQESIEDDYADIRRGN